MARFIFITGGVVSSLGKGLMAASLAALLQARGYKVRIRKFDPYLNVDPGTMSPYQHGEVFVTDDGAETDLDLGHYERFTGVSAHQGDNITSGRIYQQIIPKERRGDYLGATVQVIPHVTDQIKEFALADTDGPRFRVVRIRRHRGRYRRPALHRGDPPAAQRIGARGDLRHPCHAGPLCFGGGRAQDQADPALGARADQPRRPARHAAVPLRISAARKRARQDRTVLQRPPRSGDPGARRGARSTRCRCSTTRKGSTPKCCAISGSTAPEPDLARWDDIIDRYIHPEGEVTIAVVGKYVGLPDAYKSLNEALVHGGMANRVKVNIRWIDAEIFELDDSADRRPARADAWDPRARRLRHARDRRQDRQRALCARARCAVLRHLPGHADGLHRRCAEHGGDRQGLIDRVRADRRAGGRHHHRMDDRRRHRDARGRRGPGRDDAARRLSGEARGQQPRFADL